MNTAKICQDCGTLLAADNPQGLCPGCLMKAGFETREGTASSRQPELDLAGVAAIFPQLEILGLLGKGGMGTVYKARQPALDRVVALKILPSAAGEDPGFAERFNREARVLARLNHQNIVGLYDFGQTNGIHYFIMEFVDGANLRQLQRSGQLAPEQALKVVPQICEALQFAHEMGVVHRDIKPENVLLDKKGRVKIADFGLARIIGIDPANQRLTGARDLVGTPHYMAPEQVERPQNVDHRADIYSLGVVFYEMLTGELPLGRFSPPSSKVQVDIRLDEVVLHALEKEPERRYQHASEVKTDVEAVTAGGRPANAELASKAKKKAVGWGMIIGIALGALLLIALLALAITKGKKRPNENPGDPEIALPTENAAPSSVSHSFPVVIGTFPTAAADDVDASVKFIAVTFSKQMVDRSWAWCNVSADTAPEITGSPFYEPDGCTCVLPVRLRPGRLYALWINTETNQTFRDIDGYSAVPYLLVFQTKP